MPLGDKDCVASFKILILGDASVGKSALLRCLMGKQFQDRLYPTIATDFVKKTFAVDGALIELQVWDTAGQERFRSVTKWQYRGVKGVAMVYDVTDPSTFSHLSYWIQSVNQEILQTHNKYEAVPIVLIGNKSDLKDQRQISTRQGRQLADKELAFEFIETSAKTGDKVYHAFHRLAYHVTEICDPYLMKSYYPNMIRTCKDDAKVVSIDTSASRPCAIFKKSKSKVTLVTAKPEGQGQAPVVKLKQKSSRKKNCCKI